MRRGLTLVEVILSVSLAAVSIIFLLGLFPSTAFLSRKAEQTVAAAEMAESITSLIASRSFDEVKAQAGKTLTVSDPGPYAEVLKIEKGPGGAQLEPSVRIQALPPNDRLVQINVEVRWKIQERWSSEKFAQRISSVR